VVDVRRVETTLDDPAVDALLEQWNTEIGFVPKGGSTVEIDDFAAPGGTFLVGMTDGVPVCCGGVRRLSAGIGEIKRVYVRSDVRRQGIARRLLAELEQRAAALGFIELRLDTHAAEPAALFAAIGYEPISDYNRNRNARYWFAKQVRATE
jgi:GNAT superfamily N-acetyltransferase